MRHIGSLPDETQARVFGDFLVANGIRNEIEREADGAWVVWVVEEDRVAAAQTWLGQYRADPNAPEFRKAATEAAKVRAAEAEDLRAYRERVRTRRSIFPKFGGYGVGVLTYALIIACIAVAIFSQAGEDKEILRPLLIADPAGDWQKFLADVRAGEVWRLFTPIFIHFGWPHLIFNMMWLYHLGCMIEGRQSTWMLAVLVAVTALLSNFVQFYFSRHFYLGGMSGVVYGLGGYVWMRGKYHRASGLSLDPQSVKILLVWLVVCYSNILRPLIGSVANTAHLVGLIVGVVWGRVSAYFASRRPE